MIAVDLFAGLGGFTEGARLAGVRTAWASNHWPLAVELRAAMGFRASYRLPARKRDAEHMLGNAVTPPVAEFLVREVWRAVA